MLVTGGAGYIGSHAAKALRAAGSRGRHLRQPVGRAIARRRSARRSSRATSATWTPCAGRLRESGASAVMHFAAWLDVGGVGPRSDRLLPEQRDRRARHARGDGGGAGAHASSSRPPAPSTASRARRRSARRIRRSPINAYGQTKLAVEHALPHFERAYGIRSVCLRYFNAAGADPDGELGEDHAPEIHVIPARVRRRVGRPSDRHLRRRLPDAGRHVPARLRPRLRPRRRARAWRCAGSKRAAPRRTYNVGTGRPSSVREVIAVGRARHGAAGAARRSAPRRPGDPAVLFASAARIRDELGWMPAARRTSTRSWPTRGAGTAAHPCGFRERPPR